QAHPSGVQVWRRRRCWRCFSWRVFAMANNQPIYLTAEGFKKVQEEYDYLTGTRRKEVAQMIAEAKAEGDISENAGYDEAKTAQGFLEGRIRELENILKNAKLIEDHEHPADVVSIGRTVVVREE